MLFPPAVAGMGQVDGRRFGNSWNSSRLLFTRLPAAGLPYSPMRIWSSWTS